MKVQYVSPFASAAVTVFEQLVGVLPERGQLAARPQMFTTQQINIVCGVTGDVEGLVIFSMSMITADRVASKMIGAPVVTFDQLAASAISELANIICGQSLMQLAGSGYTCDITPPTIIRGSNVRISTLDIPAIVIPLTLKDIGAFEVNVSLQERAKRANLAA